MALTRQITITDPVRPRLFVALELSSKKWGLASTSGDGGDRVREKTIAAGDKEALERELEAAKKRFGLDTNVEVHSAYEAGRDAFWVHRFVERRDELRVAMAQAEGAAVDVHVEEPAAIEIHHLRAWRSGPAVFADFHVMVPRFWELQRAHDLGNRLCQAALEPFDGEGDAVAHLDPCTDLYCSHCRLSDCPVREAPFVAALDRSLAAMTGLTLKDRETRKGPAE